MIFEKETAKTLASYLLQINAIKLNLQHPYTWASGWKSPVYCDNRLTLSYPLIRNYIKEQLARCVTEKFPDTVAVAGVATAGIPHGALVADALQKPFIYVRSAPKAHGLTNMIEGKLDPGTKVIVVEDLISTGKSSLQVVSALRDAGADVLGMISIFTYGFDKANEAFAAAGCTYYSLTNYAALIELAVEQNYVQADAVASLEQWRAQPEVWGQ